MEIGQTRSSRYWRMRAEEFRTKAENCEYAQTREALRNVAKRFEELARCAEKFETAKKMKG